MSGTINTGDTAWMLISTALVVFMIPGLALFYGGLARQKNLLATMMQSFVTMGAVMLLWVIAGYSIAFGDGNAVWGGLSHLFLRGIGPTDIHGTIPTYVFIAYQGAFACITPALISGAIAERIKFGPYLFFILVWSLLIYAPVCHWVWHSNGFLYQMGVIDFAGGIVVHLTSGIAGLIACLILGKRKDFDKGIIPHNIPFVVLGAGILWFGWFGFNAGSALQANTSAGLAFLNTFVGPAAGMSVWLLAERIHLTKCSTLGAATGAIAGLATVTPAAGSTSPFEAIVLASISTLVCYFFVSHKGLLGYDDSLDAFGVHGISGIVGPIGCGVFASVGYNSLFHSGLPTSISGMSQLGVQLKSVGIVALYSAILTSILVLVWKKFLGFRVNLEDEDAGLDLTLHGERAYN